MPRTAALKESAPPRPLHERHRPEKTLLYRIVDRHYPEFVTYMTEQGRSLPHHVQKEFDEYMKCGRLEHGFLRVQCCSCQKEWLVAFSCTNSRRFRRTTRLSPRGAYSWCPSCGVRRMAESAALLVDEVLPHEPMRQWVLSFPYQLRFLFASRPDGLGVGYRLPSNCFAPYQKKAGLTRKTVQSGAVTLIQRFGSALNLNPHAARSTSTCCS